MEGYDKADEIQQEKRTMSTADEKHVKDEKLGTTVVRTFG